MTKVKVEKDGKVREVTLEAAKMAKLYGWTRIDEKVRVLKTNKPPREVAEAEGAKPTPKASPKIGKKK